MNDKLYVTFASLQDPHGGVVDVFDTDGHLLTPNHFAANAPGAGPLENPWGSPRLRRTSARTATTC